jgi:hypothetical protein
MHGIANIKCVRFSAELFISRDVQDFLFILEYWNLFLPRFVSWRDIFNAVSGSAWTTLTYLDQVCGLNTYIGCRHQTRPRFVTGPKSRAASNIQIVNFHIHRTCIQTTCENGYTSSANDVTFIIPINVFFFISRASFFLTADVARQSRLPDLRRVSEVLRNTAWKGLGIWHFCSDSV